MIWASPKCKVLCDPVSAEKVTLQITCGKYHVSLRTEIFPTLACQNHRSQLQLEPICRPVTSHVALCLTISESGFVLHDSPPPVELSLNLREDFTITDCGFKKLCYNHSLLLAKCLHLHSVLKVEVLVCTFKSLWRLRRRSVCSSSPHTATASTTGEPPLIYNSVRTIFWFWCSSNVASCKGHLDQRIWHFRWGNFTVFI